MRGNARLREALRRAAEEGREKAKEDKERRGDSGRPLPADAWGWAVEERLADLEDASRWQTRIIVGALIGQFVLAILERLVG